MVRLTNLQYQAAKRVVCTAKPEARHIKFTMAASALTAKIKWIGHHRPDYKMTVKGLLKCLETHSVILCGDVISTETVR